MPRGGGCGSSPSLSYARCRLCSSSSLGSPLSATRTVRRPTMGHSWLYAGSPHWAAWSCTGCGERGADPSQHVRAGLTVYTGAARGRRRPFGEGGLTEIGEVVTLRRHRLETEPMPIRHPARSRADRSRTSTCAAEPPAHPRGLPTCHCARSSSRCRRISARAVPSRSSGSARVMPVRSPAVSREAPAGPAARPRPDRIRRPQRRRAAVRPGRTVARDRHPVRQARHHLPRPVSPSAPSSPGYANRRLGVEQ